MDERARARLLVAVSIAGVAATGFVVWATAPPRVPPAPPAVVQARAAAAVLPEPSMIPRPSSTTVRPATTSTTAAGRAVPDCTPAPLARRAAQTLIVGLPDVKDPSHPMVEEVLDAGVGGIFLNAGNVESRAQVIRLTSGIRGLARRPIVIAVDEEPGRVSTFYQVLGSSPSARRMADEQRASEVRAYARQLAADLSLLGVDMNLAPVADLYDGPYSDIIGDRSFSSDPAIASEYALAYAAGLSEGGVLPVAKHFPGQGRSAEDLHVQAAEPAAVPLEVLRLTDVRPFRDLVRAGVPVVMLNHLRYEALDADLPASLSPAAYALLRDLGFSGVAITDSLGMGAVNLTWGFYDSAAMAIAAGADGVLATDGFFVEEMVDGMLDSIRAGRLTESRLNEAAARMAALAGDDPQRLACLDLELPEIVPASIRTP